MGRLGRSRNAILAALARGGSLSYREIMAETGLSHGQVNNALHRCWRGGLVLRTSVPIHSRELVFRGRSGVSLHNCPFHLYMLRPYGVDEVVVEGRRYVGFLEEFLDPRGRRWGEQGAEDPGFPEGEPGWGLLQQCRGGISGVWREDQGCHGERPPV